MILQSRKLFLLSILFFFVYSSFAQDDLDYCDLAATDDIIFNSVGNDYLDFYWIPVPGANSYEVLVIDLNTNITAHQSIEYATDLFIPNIEVTECTFVSVTSRCASGALGGTTGTNPGTCGLIFEDLVLQSTMPNGSTIDLMCGDLILEKSAPSWGTNNGPGTIGFDLNISSIIMSEIRGYNNNHTNVHPYSIMLLGVKNGTAYSKFPVSNTLTNQAINTIPSQPVSPPHPADAKILDGTNSHTFYDISVDQSASIIAGLDFTIPYNNNVTMETRYCLQGIRRPFTMHEEYHGGTVGLQSDGHSNRVGFLDDLVFKNTPFSAQTVNLSPNPTSDQLTINVPAIGVVEILDINGHSWYKVKVQDTQIEIPVTNWPAGTYILRYDGKDASIVERFIKL